MKEENERNLVVGKRKKARKNPNLYRLIGRNVIR